MPSLTEIGVVVAVAGAGFAVVRDVLRYLADRKKDAHALNVAKAQQPEIMRQLEAGNFRNAAEGITFAQQMMRDSLDTAQAELRELRPLRGEVDRLRLREEQLEETLRRRDAAYSAEIAGWRKRADESDARAHTAERLAVQADEAAQHATDRVAELESVVAELRAQLAG